MFKLFIFFGRRRKELQKIMAAIDDLKASATRQEASFAALKAAVDAKVVDAVPSADVAAQTARFNAVSDAMDVETTSLGTSTGTV